MPGVRELAYELVVFLLFGAAVYGLSRVLRCDLRLPHFHNPKRSALYALIAFIPVTIMISVLILTQMKLRGSVDQPIKVYQLLVPQVIALAIYIIPAALAMVKNRESLITIGITRRNLWQSLVIGSALIVGTFFASQGVNLSKLSKLGPHHGISFAYFLCVGFGEEFFFRGYLQTRLIAWLGKLPGWVLTSVIMGCFHIINGLLIKGMSFPQAIAFSITFIPVSLLMGFVMLRTQNLLAPGLLHGVGQWVSIGIK